MIDRNRIPVYSLVIDPDISSYLQMLQYEANGYNVLVNHAIRAEIMPNERFDQLLTEARDAHTTFQLAFDEICKMLLPEEYLSGEYQKQVNYLTHDLHVYLNEGNGGTMTAGCNCYEPKYI